MNNWILRYPSLGINQLTSSTTNERRVDQSSATCPMSCLGAISLFRPICMKCHTIEFHLLLPQKKKHMQKITWDKMSHKIREMSPNAA
jgi:hypothetical protein